MAFKVATRIQTNLVAYHERKLINWICPRLPLWMTPDKLTLIGVAGAVLVLAGYALSRQTLGFLWLASFGSVLHWFGDSHDGSLARFRRVERPTYGYFLDHSVDAICNLLIVGGLGLAPFVRMDVALIVLIGYYLLCMYVFLNNHVTGVFQLTFVAFGPTELRIGMICLNTWMFFQGASRIVVNGTVFSVYDFFLLGVAAIFVAIFVARTLIMIKTLRDRETPKAGRPLQSVSTNASILSK